MSASDWLFLFAAIQAIGAVFAMLVFFGINLQTLTNSRWSGMITGHSKFKWVAIVLIVGSFAFSGIGWYRNSQIRVCAYPRLSTLAIKCP